MPIRMVFQLERRPACAATGRPRSRRPLQWILATVLWSLPALPADGQGIDLVIDGRNFEVAMVTMSEEQIRQMFLGTPPQAALLQVKVALDETLGIVNQIDSLTTADRAKLQMAAQMDLDRFFGEVDRYTRAFTDQYAENLSASARAAQFWRVPRDKVAEARRVASSFRQQLERGIFGPGSLFQKTLRSVLDDDGIEAYNQAKLKQDQAVYRGMVEGAVKLIDRRANLTDSQQTRLVELILSKTEVPEELEPYSLHHIFAFRQMAQISDEEFKAVLDESQLAVAREFIRGATSVQAVHGAVIIRRNERARVLQGIR